MTDTGGVSLENALCAACGGRVGDARCATCRAALEQLRQQSRLPAGAFLLTALAVLLAVLVLQQL
jgi:hypothetical protein